MTLSCLPVSLPQLHVSKRGDSSVFFRQPYHCEGEWGDVQIAQNKALGLVYSHHDPPQKMHFIPLNWFSGVFFIPSSCHNFCCFLKLKPTGFLWAHLTGKNWQELDQPSQALPTACLPKGLSLFLGSQPHPELKTWHGLWLFYSLCTSLVLELAWKRSASDSWGPSRWDRFERACCFQHCTLWSFSPVWKVA
jgi:hypothetical protein